MDPDAAVDDNKYTIGIAAWVCVLSWPVVYWLIRLIAEPGYTAWTPWLAASALILFPPLTAFLTLYFGAWQNDWPRYKRVLLSALLSFVIYGADLALVSCYLAGFCLAFANPLFAPFRSVY